MVARLGCTLLRLLAYFCLFVYAGVAQLVEHQPSKLRVAGSSLVARSKSVVATVDRAARVAQMVERVLGKDEVSGSIPLTSSKACPCEGGLFESTESNQLYCAEPLRRLSGNGKGQI